MVKTKSKIHFLRILLDSSHHSKSQIFVQKFKFWQNPNIFTSFSPKILLTIFLVKSKLSAAKKSKTEAFSWVFTENNSIIFLGKSKLNFWTQNGDFEQCGRGHTQARTLFYQVIGIFFKGDRTPKSNPSLSRTIEILTIELGGSQDKSKKESLPYSIATIVLIQDFVASYSRNDICHNAALMVVKLVYDLTDL